MIFIQSSLGRTLGAVLAELRNVDAEMRAGLKTVGKGLGFGLRV